MNRFDLDPRLAADCYELGRLEFCRILLMKSDAVPWFVLVPETTATEICQLAAVEQALLWTETDLVSKLVLGLDKVKKINVAAIGNVVSQLHIHVVGRHPGDYCWPGVVWGRQATGTHSDASLHELRGACREQLGDRFSSAMTDTQRPL